MTTLSLDNLYAAAARILDELGRLSAEQDTLKLQQLEQCARALNAQLKAIQDLEAHHLRQAQTEIGQKYTRYEDLPPPSPDEQDRFYARLKSAIHRIETGPEI